MNILVTCIQCREITLSVYLGSPFNWDLKNRPPEENISFKRRPVSEGLDHMRKQTEGTNIIFLLTTDDVIYVILRSTTDYIQTSFALR